MMKDNHVYDYDGDDDDDLASIHVAEQKLKVVGVDILSQHISDFNRSCWQFLGQNARMCIEKVSRGEIIFKHASFQPPTQRLTIWSLSLLFCLCYFRHYHITIKFKLSLVSYLSQTAIRKIVIVFNLPWGRSLCCGPGERLGVGQKRPANYWGWAKTSCKLPSLIKRAAKTPCQIISNQRLWWLTRREN